MQSALAVPLQARGARLGDITLLAVAGGRQYDGADLALVEEVARRAGLSVQNARLPARSPRSQASCDEPLPQPPTTEQFPFRTITCQGPTS